MKSNPKSIVSIGTFDGVHLGHQKIIKNLLGKAAERGLVPVVVTFFPHPTHILTPEKPLKMLNSIDERVELLKKQGVQKVVVETFTREFAGQSAWDFIQNRLLNDLQMQSLVVGYDHGFGKGKEADYPALKAYGAANAFEVFSVEALKKDGQIVSSTRIRNLLQEGNLSEANALLSYPYCLYGKVVKGNQLGRKIGFQTANIVLDYPNKMVPKRGVYIVKSTIDKTLYYGMMNIGFRPTVDGKKRTIEVHYFNMNRDLYDRRVKVKILKRIRDEMKFDSVEQLKMQLKKDKLQAVKFIENGNHKTS